MLDITAQALPMVQLLGALGTQGSLHLQTATGLTIDFSFQLGSQSGGTPSSPSNGASYSPPAASGSTLPPGLPSLPLGLPSLPPANMSGLEGMLGALEQTGSALVGASQTIMGAVSAVSGAWTGLAAQQATKRVAEASDCAAELGQKNGQLAQSVMVAQDIVISAALEIAGLVAKFLGEARTASSLPVPINVLTIVELAASHLIQAIGVFEAAHAQFTAPTADATASGPNKAQATLTINPTLQVPDVGALAQGALSLGSSVLPHVEGALKMPGMDTALQMGGGSLPTGHIAWGEDADVRANPANTTAASAGATSASPSTSTLQGYSGPSGAGNATAAGAAGPGAPMGTSAGVGTMAGMTGMTGDSAAQGARYGATQAPASTTTGVAYAPTSSTGGFSATPVNGSHSSTMLLEGYVVDYTTSSLDIVLPDGSTTHAPNEIAARAIRSALTQLGVPYVWGGTTPGIGLDCSGLTQWSYEQAGLEIGRTTWDQDNNPQVPIGDALPGDLIMWDGHVGMLLGNGLMIEAGDPVSISPVRTENAGMAFEDIFRPWLGATA